YFCVWLLDSSPSLMTSITSGMVYSLLDGPTNENEPVGALTKMTGLPVSSVSHLKTSRHGLPSMLNLTFFSSFFSSAFLSSFLSAFGGGRARVPSARPPRPTKPASRKQRHPAPANRARMRRPHPCDALMEAPLRPPAGPLRPRRAPAPGAP